MITTKRTLNFVLIGINLVIILIIALFPSKEWMNYLVIVLIGILTYFSWLAHVRFFGNPNKGKELIISLLYKVCFGLSLSIASMIIIIGTISLLGGYSEGPGFVEFDSVQLGSTDGFFETIILYASSALAEETMFRSIGIGILMIPLAALHLKLTNAKSRIKEMNVKSVFRIGLILNIIIALVFGFVHKGSPGFGLIPFLNITLSGFIYGYLFLQHRDVVSAWSMHLSWNLIQMFCGLPVSGKYVPSTSLADSFISGAKDSVIAGGGYGPEGSIITLLVQIGLVLLLFIKLKSTSQSAGTTIRSELTQMPT